MLRRHARLPALLVVLLLGLLGGIGLLAGPATAQEAPAEDVTLVLFHGEGCPHCATEREFLVGLSQRHPGLVVEEYEVWFDESNQALLLQTAQRLGFEPSGVPVTVLGDTWWIGFGPSTAVEIEAAVTAALAGADPAPPSPGDLVDVPLVGSVDLAGRSLLLTTLVIGFVDGVNPCSLWVLSVLLAIVLHRGSRGRVVLVGGTFLAVTTAMYGLYIVGMYTAMDYLGGLGWIRLVVAAIALTFGIMQLKDGLAPGVGPSLSISAQRRPGLYRRMRAVSRSDLSLPAVLGGTVVLAAGVSLLETPCTAGLPLLWTSILAEQGVTGLPAVLLFVTYMAVFLLDELIVFTVAVVTLRATRLQERHGQALKMIAGSVLIALAIAMLIAPQALTSVTGTLVVFGAAGLLSLVLWLIARRQRRSASPRAPAR